MRSLTPPSPRLSQAGSADLRSFQGSRTLRFGKTLPCCPHYPLPQTEAVLSGSPGFPQPQPDTKVCQPPFVK